MVTRLDHLSNTEVLAVGRKIASDMETEIRKVVYGPELRDVVDLLIMAVFSNSHIMLRAPVGLGKTLTCRAFARTLGGKAAIRQFRPDMLPTELSGYEAFDQKAQEYETHHGPLLGTNVFLADEINRAPAKVQSALLEAMEERHLTVGKHEYPLERVFLVLATRNPIEHEGTYDLPEAQLDRFFAQASIGDISEETVLAVMSDKDFWRPPSDRLQRVNPVTTPEEIVAIREVIFTTIHVEPRLDRYIEKLRRASGKHALVQYGASPRGALNLRMAAIVSAFRAGRQYAIPEDVQKYAVDVLAHRIFKKPEARFDPEGTSSREIVQEVLNVVKPD